jgi:hypothetical protein
MPRTRACDSEPMTAGYGYPQYGSPPAPVAVARVVAAGLFVVAAALALAGSFAAFSVYRFESELSPASTTTTTGWGSFEDPVPAEPLPTPRILYGIPITAAAVLALVVALLLVLSARRTHEPAAVRSLGVGIGGLLVGVVSVIWLQLVTIAQNVVDAAQPGDEDAGIRTSYQVGVGGYLILVAALLALAAAVLLLVPRRASHAPTAVPPGTGLFPPLGPGGQPQWQPASPYWPQPAPPPGWGPTPPPHG